MNQAQPIYLNFDASQVEPQTPFEPLPADDYTLTLVAAQVRETNKRTGHYLAMDYVVTEGQFKGRHVWENLNLWNASQQASEIAWRQLSGLCHAAGVLQVKTVDQLFNIPVKAKIGVETDDYGTSNTIKGFTKIEGQAGAPTPPQPAQPQEHGGDLPWGPSSQPAQPAQPAQPQAPAQPQQPAEQSQPASSGTDAPPWANQQPAQQAQGEEQPAPPWAR